MKDDNKITILLRSRERAERTVREIIDAQIQREKLTATRDAAVAKVLAQHDPEIDAHTARIDRDFELLENWADENAEEFAGAKSIVLGGHRLGWRTGQPTVKTRGKLTFKTIVARLVEAGGELKARFVREKPELNKEAVLELNRIASGTVLPAGADAMNPDEIESARQLARAELKQLGVQVTQTEAFYLEPDREGQADIRLSGEAKEAA